MQQLPWAANRVWGIMELQTGGGQAAAQGTTDSPPSAVESASERVSRAVGSPLSVILVIGATGQVGLGLVRRLIDRGEDVAALVRPSTDSTIVAATGAAIVRGDLRNPVSLRSVCEGVDTVVATANTIVPRRGERADFDALARGYESSGGSPARAGLAGFCSSRFRASSLVVVRSTSTHEPRWLGPRSSQRPARRGVWAR